MQVLYLMLAPSKYSSVEWSLADWKVPKLPQQRILSDRFFVGVDEQNIRLVTGDGYVANCILEIEPIFMCQRVCVSRRVWEYTSSCSGC